MTQRYLLGERTDKLLSSPHLVSLNQHFYISFLMIYIFLHVFPCF